MASTQAIAVFDSVYRRTDKQIRDLLEDYLRHLDLTTGDEIDTINVVIGSGVDVITPGVAVVIRVDFNAVITGAYFQEFDGITGSIRIDVERSPGSNTPSWARISPATRPGFTAARYAADDTVTSWLTTIDRGDYLRFVVFSAATIMRVHVGLRIRRLEP